MKLEDLKLKTKDIKRFWKYVDKNTEDDCWLWTGYKNKKGYGRLWISIKGKGKLVRAHRIMWLIAQNEIPDGICVAHHCDNSSCVNPKHLFLATVADNNHDMIQKGRNSLFGQPPIKRRNAKLNAQQVREIKSLYSSGNMSYRKLGERYNVDYTTIQAIIKGRIWNHVG